MTDGVRRGLIIALAAVLSIALVLVAAAAWFGRGMAAAHDGVDARARAFCDSIAIGSNIASLAARPWPQPQREPVDATNGATQYRFRFFGGAYWEADCHVTADASGRIVAKQAGRPESFQPDRVIAASAAAGG